MGAAEDGAPIGPIELRSFDPSTLCLGEYKLVGPPGYDDRVQYCMETGWSMDRDVLDVTSRACRELGVDEKVFAGYLDGSTPRNPP